MEASSPPIHFDGDFAELNDYIASKMMWEPTLNGTELSASFLKLVSLLDQTVLVTLKLKRCKNAFITMLGMVCTFSVATSFLT